MLTASQSPAGADPVHTLPDDAAKADAISFATSPANSTNKVFVDGYGRQVVLRGYAVSGSTKLRETELLPFKTTADAKASFAAMKKVAGSNVVRFQLLWEGSEPVKGTMTRPTWTRSSTRSTKPPKWGCA
ncbi:hypothetical protein [Streptomyces sp. NPDC005533]|uniref:hypothetical protein n=1 Tax=Streptomyces sp. NPDC005533 TaxID=3364723 RepID=UPI003698074C